MKPLENLRVRSVPSESYKTNEFCASPMSDAGVKADDDHHCFPRSQIGGSSYFVEITEDNGQISLPIPHVVGLSREQHERVERHDAWIRYEDGIWNWYERERKEQGDADGPPFEEWRLEGPLNPQPGSRESKPRRKRFKGEAKRQRKTISIRVPADSQEQGAAIYDELLEQAQEKLKIGMEVDYLPTPYVTLIAVLYEFVA